MEREGEEGRGGGGGDYDAGSDVTAVSKRSTLEVGGLIYTRRWMIVMWRQIAAGLMMSRR